MLGETEVTVQSPAQQMPSLQEMASVNSFRSAVVSSFRNAHNMRLVEHATNAFLIDQHHKILFLVVQKIRQAAT